MGKTKEEIRAGALVFGNAANTLGIIGEAVLKADNFYGKQLIAQNLIPSIVLKVFSCELFLKSLIPKRKLQNIHKLDELFNLLNRDNKKYIVDNVITTLSAIKNQYDESDFEADLNDTANAFVDWRYFYEKSPSINILFLNTLFNVLRNQPSNIENVKS